MEEYWDMLLNWLGMGQGGLPTAPRAEDRYANSRRVYNDDPYVQHSIKFNGSNTTGVIQNTPYSILPAIITRSIGSGGDTLYAETPEQKRFRLRGVPKRRKASSRDKNKKEYETLKRRFNTAWSLAK